MTVGKDVYIAYGNKIGILDMGVDTDDGEQITTSIVSGDRLAQRLFLLLFSYNFVSTTVSKVTAALRLAINGQNLLHSKRLVQSYTMRMKS